MISISGHPISAAGMIHLPGRGRAKSGAGTRYVPLRSFSAAGCEEDDHEDHARRPPAADTAHSCRPAARDGERTS